MCDDDTPLRTLSFVKEFGYTGDTRAGDAVTTRTYNHPDEANEYTQLFLKCSQCPDHVPEVTISEEFITKGYAHRWKMRHEKRQVASAVDTLDIIHYFTRF